MAGYLPASHSHHIPPSRLQIRHEETKKSKIFIFMFYVYFCFGVCFVSSSPQGKCEAGCTCIRAKLGKYGQTWPNLGYNWTQHGILSTENKLKYHPLAEISSKCVPLNFYLPPKPLQSILKYNEHSFVNH